MSPARPGQRLRGERSLEIHPEQGWRDRPSARPSLGRQVALYGKPLFFIFSPTPGESPDQLRAIPWGGSTFPSCDGQGPPYLGEGFEPQCCDNCSRGCAHISCPQLAEKAELTPVSQALPISVAPPKKGTAHPSRAPGYLGPSLSSTTNTDSPNGVYLCLHQVSIVPSHSSLLFKAPPWCFGMSQEPG